MSFRRSSPTLLAVVLSLALCGCATAGATARHRQSVSVAGEVSTNRPPSAEFHAGRDRLRILHGGAVTFEILRGLVDAARSEVDVEMYEFGRADMATALVNAHRRGVGVTVIVDPTVDVSAATELRLRAAGIDVVEYPVRARMIDHVKLMVVDESIGVVGGINWGSASQFNHDVDAVVQGPAAANLLHVFRRDLVTAGETTTVPPSVPDDHVIIATTLPSAEIRPLALDAINGATSTLDLELYVVTDTGIVNALVKAQRRGVRVRVLLDPSERPSDGPAAMLRSAGVAVRLYRSNGELLHAKFVVADSRAVLFGSANWSKGGFMNNHECDAYIPDAPGIAADFEAAVDADWSASA